MQQNIFQTSSARGALLATLVLSSILQTPAVGADDVYWAQPVSGPWRNPAMWVGGVVPGNPKEPPQDIFLDALGTLLYTTVVDDHRRAASISMPPPEAALRVFGGGIFELLGHGGSQRSLWLHGGTLRGGTWSLPAGIDLTTNDNRLEGVTLTDPEGITFSRRTFDESEPTAVRISDGFTMLGDTLTAIGVEVRFEDADITIDYDFVLNEEFVAFDSPGSVVTFVGDRSITPLSASNPDLFFYFAESALVRNTETLTLDSEARVKFFSHRPDSS